MKRVIIIASGWAFLLGGCDQGLTDRFDVPAAKIVALDEDALPEDVQAQLSEIDQKLARIDSQLDQRLSAIERRLLNVENAAGQPSRIGVGDTIDAQSSDQPALQPPVVEPAAPTVFVHNVSAAKHEYVGPKNLRDLPHATIRILEDNENG